MPASPYETKRLSAPLASRTRAITRPERRRSRLLFLATAAAGSWIFIAGPAAANPIYTLSSIYELADPNGNTPVSVNSPYGPPQTGSQTVSGKFLWTGAGSGTVRNAIDLTPTNLATQFTLGLEAYGTDGSQEQVGEGEDGQRKQHALLWKGSGSNAVDLSPTNLNGFSGSVATATKSGQQVGYGFLSNGTNTHALLWNGSGSNTVDLNPTNLVGFSTSKAYATDGIHQVGEGGVSATGTNSHALLWGGSGSNAVDLNPVNLSSLGNTVADGVSGNQQVGYGISKSNALDAQAILWTGSGTSAVALSTEGLGLVDSVAFATNGSKQVGYGYNENGFGYTEQHAVLWQGTSGAAVDLQFLLPGSLVSSSAYSIDSIGDVFGIAQDSKGNSYAVEFTPTPEPGGLGLLCLAGISLLRRRHPR